VLSETSILDQLRQAGYRITQPRRAVLQALLQEDGYQSPAEVHARAKMFHPTIGLVTVYRTLDLLAEQGLVRRIHTEDGCHGYASASQGHRHHLVCRSCGAAIEFEGCDLTSFFERIGRATGYRVDEHLLELVGVCPACQRAPASDGADDTVQDSNDHR
jgi:Fur family ferric uptake transcriptional regulator